MQVRASRVNDQRVSDDGERQRFTSGDSAAVHAAVSQVAVHPGRGDADDADQGPFRRQAEGLHDSAASHHRQMLSDQ